LTRRFGTVMRISGSTSGCEGQLASLVFQGVTLTTSQQKAAEYAVLNNIESVNEAKVYD
jgi:hypothetical protein